MKRRFVSILMALVMALSLLPAQALAEDNAVTELNKNNISNYVTNGLGNGTYKLTEDVTITSTLNITGDTTVDLNGHVLRYDEAANPDSIFHVKAGKLTLRDSRPEAEHEDKNLPAGGLITGGKGYRQDGGGGGYHIYYYYGGGVYVEAGGASFMLAGGTIYACGVQSGANYAYGGGIYAEGGSVTMTGGAIRNCVVSTDYSASGGAIYAKDGSVTMSGGVISGCSAMSGGGISAAGCTVQITGGRIENCKASGRGGGLSVSDHTNGPVSVLDAVISGCEAENGGGVALIGFAELELGENARITGCTATNGAAVYMDIGSTYTVNHPGCFLYANGGRVEGTVYVGTNKIGTKNNYSDSVKATNAIDHTDEKPTTVFTGDVYCAGDIRGGSFYGSVTAPDSADSMGTVWKKICGNISGGTFYGPVTTECHVSGGTFYDGLTLKKDAKLSGKPVNTGTKINDKTNIPDPTGTPVTVTYKDGNGEYAKQIVQAGEKAIQPDVPSRQGYQFTDWYLDDTKYDFNTTVTGNMTLTAQWSINQYTITFDTDGGSAIAPITQDYGTAIAAPAAPTKTGYTFAGWDTEIPTTMPAGDMTIKANWAVNQYTITFNTDGGSAIAPITQGYGTAITAPAAPTKTGYTFAGWDRTIPATMPAEDLTLTAHWAACDHANSGNKPTCTADTTCTVCGGTIEKLGHDWGDWTPSSNKTHTRTCKIDSTHTETKNGADDNKDHVCDTCGATLTQHSGGTASCTAPATCGYCGKPYGEKNPANHSDLKHVPAKAATTQAEGNSEYWLCSGCGKCYKDAAAATEIALSDTVIAKRIPRRYSGPTITVMGAAYYDGGNVGLTFVSSADFDTFTGVQVDGKTLAAKNYIAERGSIEVYLKAVYLRTLKNGSHTVTIQSTAGDVSAVFTVENSKTSPGTSDPGVAVYALSSMLSLAGLAALRRRKED